MRRNKQDRSVKYKCYNSKCQSGGIVGIYYSNEHYYCSKNCLRKSSET